MSRRRATRRPELTALIDVLFILLFATLVQARGTAERAVDDARKQVRGDSGLRQLGIEVDVDLRHELAVHLRSTGRAPTARLRARPRQRLRLARLGGRGRRLRHPVGRRQARLDRGLHRQDAGLTGLPDLAETSRTASPLPLENPQK